MLEPKKMKIITSFLIIQMLINVFFVTEANSTVIRFVHSETNKEEQETINLIVKAFMNLNDDITVNTIAVEENEMIDYFLKTAKSGDLPDLIYCRSHIASGLNQRGLLDQVAVNEIINQLGRNRFFQGPLAKVHDTNTNNKFAVPFSSWIQGLWYRKDWFEKAGLEPPTTWKTIEKAAKYFSLSKDVRHGILVGTKADHYTEQVFSQIAIANNAHIFNKKGEVVIDSKQMVDALKYYKILANFGPTGENDWRARDYYIQGKLAMMFYSTFIMDDLAIASVAQDSLTGQNYSDLEGANFDPELVNNTGYEMVISNQKSSSYGSLNVLTIANTSDDEKSYAANKLARYLYQPSAYILFLHMAPGGMNPVFKDIAMNSSYLADPAYLFTRYGHDNVKKIIDGQDYIQTFGYLGNTYFPVADEISNQEIIGKMVHKHLFESMSAEDSVSWAKEQVEQIIKEFDEDVL